MVKLTIESAIRLIYVTDLKQFQTCDTTWTVIEMPAGKGSVQSVLKADIRAIQTLKEDCKTIIKASDTQLGTWSF